MLFQRHFFSSFWGFVGVRQLPETKYCVTKIYHAIIENQSEMSVDFTYYSFFSKIKLMQEEKHREGMGMEQR